MLTLDTLNVMLAVSEEGLIEEMIIALLASPQRDDHLFDQSLFADGQHHIKRIQR